MFQEWRLPSFLFSKVLLLLRLGSTKSPPRSTLTKLEFFYKSPFFQNKRRNSFFFRNSSFVLLISADKKQVIHLFFQLSNFLLSFNYLSAQNLSNSSSMPFIAFFNVSISELLSCCGELLASSVAFWEAYVCIVNPTNCNQLPILSCSSIDSLWTNINPIKKADVVKP